MKIGVVASMKKGLEHFVYRELNQFSQAHTIHLFPTRQGTGLYNPMDTWITHRWNIVRVLLAQPMAFLQHPSLYISTLRTALAYSALSDFLIAWYFAPAFKQVDVLYATFGDRKLFVAYFGKLITGKPLQVTIHAYELYQNPNPRLFVEALKACDRVVTVTEHNREILLNQFHVDPAKLEVVRINVDVNDYRPEKKFAILIAGFFVERKGHEILFKALKKMAKSDVEVWVVGGAGSEDDSVDVKRMAKDIGVESQVAFFETLRGNALKATYRLCDVFCLPCHTDRFGNKEGFPTVIAEAMAFGKPVVTTRHVEIPRIVDHILVDEKDVDGLAAALLQVYESAELRAELGEKNRKKAVDTFSLANAQKTESLLAALAGGAR